MNNIRKINKKKHFGFIDIIVIIVITAILCSASASLVTYTFSKKEYTDLSNNKPLKEFLEVYASLMTDYYELIDEEELAQSAINGMFDYLGDDYSTYLSQQSTSDLESKLSGTYQGIGVQITEGNVIYKVFEDSPALKAGLKENDIIIKVNGEDVTSKSTAEVAALIKTNKTNVDLVILRDEVEMTFNVKIEKLNSPAISYEIKLVNNKKIGYLYIETFSLTAAEQVEKALKEMETEGIESLIVDVRDNTGGYLSSASDIASLFLEKGKVIYSLQAKTGTTSYKDKTNTKRTYPIIVLTNKSSASASEILAAALKQSYGATLVGETTYGKGKVQEKMGLDDGSMVKYTTALWLTPNGDCVDKVGLGTDYKITINKEYEPTAIYGDPDYDEQWTKYSEHVQQVYEEQLNKALELLSK